jgi:tripartite-type tricarboxylate transporter receptor subunit TctC
MIEPFGAGGGPDLIARAIGPKLAELWGQPVTVENHPGAGSTAPPALVAKAAAASQPYVLVTGSSSGITTIGELIAAAKAKPGELKFASTGVGTGTHLGLEKFNLEAGIKAVHTPAKAGEAIPDVIANTVAGGATYMMAPIQLALADIQAGKLRALGVTTKNRSHLLAEVPTIAEGGVPGYDYAIWYGVWVPAGTPAAVVDKLAKDIAQVLGAQELRAWLEEHGAERMSMTQPEFARFVMTESESAKRIFNAAGLKPQ